jgi:putative MATE family efflux protein
MASTTSVALARPGETHARTVLRLATPTIIAMLSQSIVNEIDVVFFSRLPGAESSTAQAALLPSLIVLWLFGGTLSAIGVGTQALVARREAEGKQDDAGAVLGNAFTFALVAGVLMTAFSQWLLPTVMGKLIAVPEVRAVAISFTRWRLWGVVSMATTMSLKAFFDGLGKTYVHLVAALTMNVLNVVFCWAFIFGNLGAPRMGADGAALGALMATWIGFFVMLVFLVREIPRYRPFDLHKLSGALIGSILRLSIPAALATTVMMLGFGTFTTFVGRLDAEEAARAIAAGATVTEAVNGAATTDIVAVLKLTITAAIAFGTATATLVAASLGQRKPDDAETYGWTSVKLGLVIFGFAGLCEGYLFTRPIVEFIASSPAVREAAMLPMRTMGVTTPAVAVILIMSEALFGAGNPRFVAIAQFAMIFGVLLPGCWLLAIQLGFGLLGIWLAACAYCVLGACLLAWKFGRGEWKHLVL